MSVRFSYFAVLAGMRTGSNLLEERLNAMDGLTCYGEVFNPAFPGHAHNTELFGRTADQIGADPIDMIELLRQKTDGLPGFRLFRNHNDTALTACLKDPACAKVVLRRNPIESYISLRIVQQTNQWRLGDARQAKAAKAQYDGAAFRTYLEDTNGFYDGIFRQLKATGQTAFLIDYEDLNDADVLSGLGQFFGVEGAGPTRKSNTKKQNPDPLEAKVSNFDEMVADIATLDPLALMHSPSFEPARGPDVKAHVAHASVPLLFAPIPGNKSDEVTSWLSGLTTENDLRTGMNQRQLRQWKREHPGHRSFAVLRHPVLRAWDAFRVHLVEDGPQNFQIIRRTLARQHDLDIPLTSDIASLDRSDLARAFTGFLKFLKMNLNGQTMIRVDASWASQVALVQGIVSFAAPHELIFEEELPDALVRLSARFAQSHPFTARTSRGTDVLAEIYDATVESAARDAYPRDYTDFGFADWNPA